jgi:hypothetical protein
MRTWQPTHGIVFGSSPVLGNSRPFTIVAGEKVEEGLILQSKAEDSYVLASADSVTPEHQSTLESKDPVEPAAIATSIPPLEISEDPKYNELPESQSSWKMTEELFRAAKNATPGSPKSFWSHTLYRGPPKDGVSKRPTVHYCRTKTTTERVIQNYFMDKKLIGFDIEWKPDAYKNLGPKKNVSLIQIASEERIALFHLALFPGNGIDDLVAPSLKKIMEDPSVTKIGVAIKADCTRLRKHLLIHSHGLFELSHLYKLVRFSESKDFKLINKSLVSLASQVQEHLHLPLNKGEVRGSDWSQKLSLDQIGYAASDSYAGVQLYSVLDLKRQALRPTPPLPYHAELNLPIRTAGGIEIPSDEELEPENEEETDEFVFANGRLVIYAADKRAELHRHSKYPPSSEPLRYSIGHTGAESSAEFLAICNDLIVDRQTLLAYFLWHDNPQLKHEHIADLLKMRPHHAAWMVLYTIKTENMPCDKARLRSLSDWRTKLGPTETPKRRNTISRRDWRLILGLEDDTGPNSSA